MSPSHDPQKKERGDIFLHDTNQSILQSNAAHFETVNVASYVAIAVGTLFAVGL